MRVNVFHKLSFACYLKILVIILITEKLDYYKRINIFYDRHAIVRNVESFTPFTCLMFMSKRTLLKFVEIVFCSQVNLNKLSLQGFFSQD